MPKFIAKPKAPPFAVVSLSFLSLAVMALTDSNSLALSAIDAFSIKLLSSFSLSVKWSQGLKSLSSLNPSGRSEKLERDIKEPMLFSVRKADIASSLADGSSASISGSGISLLSSRCSSVSGTNGIII